MVRAQGGVGHRVAVRLAAHSAPQLVERTAGRHGRGVGEQPDVGRQRGAQRGDVAGGATARRADREDEEIGQRVRATLRLDGRGEAAIQ